MSSRIACIQCRISSWYQPSTGFDPKRIRQGRDGKGLSEGRTAGRGEQGLHGPCEEALSGEEKFVRQA
jgi:hypothetical protein